MFQILLWYPWKGKKVDVPLRTAYMSADKAPTSELRSKRGFSERTLDAEVDDPGLKKERRERWPSRDTPPVVYKRDAEVDDSGLRKKRATRTLAE
ncbi:hypothetical protein TNCV_5132041 [Trichonephila clavipes]|nr:hypothetical protein TNCV_5132041 [Trichonephila clavipes]